MFFGSNLGKWDLKKVKISLWKSLTPALIVLVLEKLLKEFVLRQSFRLFQSPLSETDPETLSLVT